MAGKANNGRDYVVLQRRVYVVPHRHFLSGLIVLLVSSFFQANGSSAPWSTEVLQYYDNLRSATTVFTNATARVDSSVIHVREQTVNTSSLSSYRLCHITSMLPLSNGGGQPQLHLGLFVGGAGLLAAIHFNAKMDAIVPDLTANPIIRNCNVRLTMDFQDTQFNPMKANQALVENVLSREHSLPTPLPSALVGATRSAVSGPLSILSSAHSLPVISYSSTSSQLENKDVYRYFGRTVPTNAGDATAAAAYFREILGVTHVGVLYVRDHFGSAFNAEFSGAAFQLDPPMHVVSASYDPHTPWESESIQEAVEQLADSGYNYFFAILPTEAFDQVMRIVSRKRMVGPGKFWLFAEVAGQILRDGFSYDAYVDGDLVEAATGVAVLSIDIRKNDVFDATWVTMNDDENLKEYFVSKQPNYLDLREFRFSRAPTFWEYLQYDAVMAMAFGACEATSEFFTGDELFDAFKNTSFVGASGPVAFDHNTGTRDVSGMSYKVVNVVANPPDKRGRVTFSSTVVAHQGNADKLSLSSWEVLKPFTHADGTDIPPAVLPPKVENRNMIGMAVVVTGLSLAGISMIISIVCAIWTFRYRHSRVVRKSQPEFLIMLCTGTFIMSGTAVPLSLQEPLKQRSLNIACMASPWLFSVGFVISFSALSSKTLRMNKIFATGRRFRRIEVRARHVIVPFLIVFISNVVVLVAWTILAPLRWQRRAMASYDSFGRSIESYGVCAPATSGTAWVFEALLFLLHVGCLLFAVYQTYRARNVPSDYNEGFYVAVSFASILQAFVIGAPVISAVAMHPPANFLIKTILTSIICAAVLFPLFVPKVLANRIDTRGSDDGRPKHRVVASSYI